MRKLMLILIALLAAVTFIRSLDVSLKAEESAVSPPAPASGFTRAPR